MPFSNNTKRILLLIVLSLHDHVSKKVMLIGIDIYTCMYHLIKKIFLFRSLFHFMFQGTQVLSYAFKKKMSHNWTTITLFSCIVWSSLIGQKSIFICTQYYECSLVVNNIVLSTSYFFSLFWITFQINNKNKIRINPIKQKN